MTKQLMKRGFTLIELLVVIAIIGILAAVVLASLNNARDKGEDAAIKQNLTNARAQAELSYSDNDRSYDDVCTNGAEDTPQGILDLITASNNAGGGADVDCQDSADAWAAEKELNTDSDGDGTGDFYCVDSTGEATTTPATSALGTDATNDPSTIRCDGSTNDT